MSALVLFIAIGVSIKFGGSGWCVLVVPFFCGCGTCLWVALITFYGTHSSLGSRLQLMGLVLRAMG